MDAGEQAAEEWYQERLARAGALLDARRPDLTPAERAAALERLVYRPQPVVRPPPTSRRQTALVYVLGALLVLATSWLTWNNPVMMEQDCVDYQHFVMC